ncbi:hypothetical protein JJB99_11365 [Bradyrhizobium diazoefficiens]|uniref:hypothetical protein n=1 Tax=Bradyrhizobium diazoefficiens TaxID=1355477 RepID=UPI001909E900|nr:hypothetical protein [Bradyrhizobium diazoefficiens]QQO16704.1 hypothetical protein JJB99_11365 [Bradyrhizobium diazoefficiens]
MRLTLPLHCFVMKCERYEPHVCTRNPITTADYVCPDFQQESAASAMRATHPAITACTSSIQYKLPESMTRNSAGEISTHQLAGLVVPFFRMPLMRRDLSGQHWRLIDLEQKFPGAVFYASPGMHNLGEFNLAYKDGRVHERSAFFSPADIGPLPDDKNHTIAYKLTRPSRTSAHTLVR